MPAAIGHGRRGIVGETDDLPLLLIGNGAVSLPVHLVVIVIEHFLQGFQFQGLEDPGRLRQGYERGCITGYGGTDHADTLGYDGAGDYRSLRRTTRINS